MKEADYDDLMLERWLRERERGEIVWQTKDGTNIPIKDMTDSHLDNAIAMIERNEEKKDNYYDALGGMMDKDWFA